MKLRSYAKINLTLDIGAKRDDGYHNVDTVLQNIDLYDEIELEITNNNNIELSCNVKALENNQNLVVKAAKLLKEKYSVKSGVNITLTKNIPSGSGLSGGSSNAAAVLKGLNSLWKLNLKKEEICRIGEELGTDIPFHIIGGTCQGSNKGEKIEKLADLPLFHILVVIPNLKISTKDAYSSLDYAKISYSNSTKSFTKDYNFTGLHNDFEYSILKKYPELMDIKKSLGINSMLSGSGSSVFGIYKTEKELQDTYTKIKNKYAYVIVSKTLNKKIDMAKEMGFCMGVKRAIDEIHKLKGKDDVNVLGYLIHNPQVIKQLEAQGIKSVTNFDNIDSGTLVISAHGIADQTIANAKAKGLDVVDLTCPLVTKVHNITKRAQNEGRKILVFGDKNHTEVKGIVGNLKNYDIIKDLNEMKEEDKKVPVAIVSQTTREVNKYDEISENLKKVNPDTQIKDTICYATKDRQSSSIELAKKSEIIIVIGGRISSNTRHLREICSKYCEAIHLETRYELKGEWFFNKTKIGITAGASTPDNIIEEVRNTIEMIV